MNKIVVALISGLMLLCAVFLIHYLLVLVPKREEACRDKGMDPIDIGRGAATACVDKNGFIHVVPQ